MVTDQQVKRLWRFRARQLSLEVAAAKAGMDVKTARKYLLDSKLPSEMKQKHLWRTRPDPFLEVWPDLRDRLQSEPGLQAKTLFEHLQRTFAGSLRGWPAQNITTAHQALAGNGRSGSRSIFRPGASTWRTGRI